MSLLEDLRWRYATKRFQEGKKISEGQISTLIEAISLAPTSYGLQPFKVIIVENEDVRKKLRAASWDQPQITECSHLFVFCRHTSYTEKSIDDYVDLKTDIQKLEPNDLKNYADFMKDKIGQLSDSAYKGWSGRQTYIALSHLLTACANQKVDACPMEGFEPEEYTKILKLKNSEYRPVVLTAVGYRSEADETQYQKKVRKPQDALFTFVK